MNNQFEEASNKVIDYLYRNERTHFIENCVDDYHTKQELVERLKEHIFYSVLVMKCKGDEDLLEKELEELWDECDVYTESEEGEAYNTDSEDSGEDEPDPDFETEPEPKPEPETKPPHIFVMGIKNNKKIETCVGCNTEQPISYKVFKYNDDEKSVDKFCYSCWCENKSKF